MSDKRTKIEPGKVYQTDRGVQLAQTGAFILVRYPHAVHINWQEDVYRPDFICPPGSRFFRDGTREEAVRLMTERLDRFAEQGHVAPPDIRAACLDAAANGRDEWADGWPMVEEA